MDLRRAARRTVYLLEKHWQLLRFRSVQEPADGWPALIGISFPKSGTHLLDQILLGFSRVAPFSTRLHSFYAEYEGESGASRGPDAALRWVKSLAARDVASAHLFARPAVVEHVASSAFVPYFIFRDPRDVAVSHVFYVTEMESRHVHHSYYSALPDFDARLRVSILGRPELEIAFPDIARRFEPYLGWIDSPAVMKIHFEDLVTNRRKTLGEVADRFMARVPVAAPRGTILAALEQAIDPSRSPTFRSGKTGEWRRYFKPEHKRLFKAVAGALLSRLDYEPDDSW